MITFKSPHGQTSYDVRSWRLQIMNIGSSENEAPWLAAACLVVAFYEQKEVPQ
jgi:hypothetical protein